MLWLSIRIATTYDFMENFLFLSYNTNPRFPHTRCKSGVAFVQRCFRDDHRYYILKLVVLLHYDNTPMLFTAIFNGCKNDNFQI